MKAAFSAEAIGLGDDMKMSALYREAGLRARSSRPWVAQITGTSKRYGMERRFLPHRNDWRAANKNATRGVMFWWTLEEGRLYQAQYRRSRNDWVTEFLRVTAAGEVERVPADEARRIAAAMGGRDA
ncbi:MAG TPA: hypothetical protein VFQ44_01695 [Streptosporangiaceae bacterium]|nr:hypothetical protein [Streptosporangiaceae bacterium]